MPFERLIRVFGDEHREFRDILLDLIDAFRNRDKRKIRSLLNQAVKIAGPHLRYEEEALYPALKYFFHDTHIAHLLSDHDQLILTIQMLGQLAGLRQIQDEDAFKAEHYIRGVLPHISDCDGLSVMIERLPAAKVRAVLKARDRALDEGLDLLNYAAEARGRKLQAATPLKRWS